MVVADNGEHTAQRGRTGGVCVLEDVTRAVDAGGLAVPDAEQAIIFCAGEQAELLRAPDSRRAEVLVDLR